MSEAQRVPLSRLVCDHKRLWWAVDLDATVLHERRRILTMLQPRPMTECLSPAWNSQQTLLRKVIRRVTSRLTLSKITYWGNTLDKEHMPWCSKGCVETQAKRSQ